MSEMQNSGHLPITYEEEYESDEHDDNFSDPLCDSARFGPDFFANEENSEDAARFKFAEPDMNGLRLRYE